MSRSTTVGRAATGVVVVILLVGCSAAASPAAGSGGTSGITASNGPAAGGAPSQAAADGGSGAPAGGDCGVHEINGVNARTFCGPASVTFTLGGEAHELKGGECTSSGDTFAINVGTIVLGDLSPKPDYFGMTIITPDGTPVADGKATGAPALAGDIGGTAFAMKTDGTVTMKNNLTAGDFEGATFTGPSPIKGSFTCG
jgi:hypothetical protein